MTVYELNLDGLVGPTHHYAGLAYGNLASMTHANQISNPREAALQGLKKVRLLHEIGIKQALLPPHPRPNLNFLQALGFSGTIATQLNQAKKNNPRALSAAYSASSMWAANTATITPSIDTQDSRVHFTVANLVHHLHRHQEALISAAYLKQIFSNQQYFLHHEMLPRTPEYNDEGAANHNRIAKQHHLPGIHLFVYGRVASSLNDLPKHFPARQSYEASQAIARKHGLKENQLVFAAQNPAAIDAGVFHNDVISLANESVFLLHEDAFLNQQQVLASLQARADFKINIIEVKRKQLSLTEAVKTYFFNAQLLSLPQGGMILVAPFECQTSIQAQRLIEELIANPDNPIQTVHYVSLKQSMQNGGGPACLRLRVLLQKKEFQAMHQDVLVTDSLLDKLELYISQHYRTTLCLDDLADPHFAQEAKDIYRTLCQILNLSYIDTDNFSTPSSAR